MVDALTHDALVERAGRWLRNRRKCICVIVEPKPWACVEHPDAIGWLSTGESILVECKVSTNDLYSDYGKNWRTHCKGMGFWRYYLTPPGLVEHPGELRGMGLLEMRGRIVKVVAEATPRQDRDWSEEVRLLTNRLAYHPTKEEKP